MITTTWLLDYQYVSFPFISFTIRLILHFHRSGKHGSFIFLHWCRQIRDVCMFFCDKCEVNAQTCSFPPSFGRKRCSLTPLRKGWKEWLTLKAWPRRPCKMGVFKQWKARKLCWISKEIYDELGCFWCFWKILEETSECGCPSISIHLRLHFTAWLDEKFSNTASV